MGRAGVMEALFIALSQNITIVGKFWLVLLVLLRVAPLLLAGFPLFWDEQERFVCSSAQPGCMNACYDVFRPLSPLRFWPIQLLVLCLPMGFFCAHVLHWTLSRPESPQSSVSHPESCHPVLCGRSKGRDFAGAYLAQVLIRMVLEAGFGVAQYRLFGLSVPRRLLCSEPPCSTAVECFSSRPAEETAALVFTLALAGLSLLLTAADLFCSAHLLCSAHCCGRQGTAPAPLRKTSMDREEERDHSPSGLRTDLLGAVTRRASQSEASRVLAGGVARGSSPGDGGAVGPNGTWRPRTGGAEQEGTPRPARSSDRADLRPPPSPRPAARRGAGLGTPTAARAHRTAQRPSVDTLDSRSESSDSPERRAWV